MQCTIQGCSILREEGRGKLWSLPGDHAHNGWPLTMGEGTEWHRCEPLLRALHSASSFALQGMSERRQYRGVYWELSIERERW